MAGKIKLKKWPQKPVYVCEDHHEVLPHIYRAIGSRHLPFAGTILVHFDAHPDLLLPDMLANDCYEKDTLFDTISIGDWILPAVYAGHLSGIIWYKMNWSTQLCDGCYQLGVGRHKLSGKLRVTLAEDYFLSELLYSPGEDLDNISTVSLLVVTFNSNSEWAQATRAKKVRMSDSGSLDALKLLTGGQHWILDIDLDFFSTANPFCSLLSKEQLKLLRDLYHFDFKENRQEAQACHEIKLQKLKDDWKQNQITNKDHRTEELEKLLSEHHMTADKAHLCGMMSDLPDHVSTEQEITNTTMQLKNWLKELPNLPCPPTMVTIARSTDDGYTPAEQVGFIQKSVLDMLNCVYDNQLDVHWCYLDD